MVLQNHQNLIEMTSNIFNIIAFGQDQGLQNWAGGPLKLIKLIEINTSDSH